MPRISIDLCLKFIPLLPRPAALIKMNNQMEIISGRIIKNIRGAQIFKKKTRDGTISKHSIKSKDATVKIEPNFVIRGTVFDCQESSICEKA
jgi:hypothetical protein